MPDECQIFLAGHAWRPDAVRSDVSEGPLETILDGSGFVLASDNTGISSLRTHHRQCRIELTLAPHNSLQRFPGDSALMRLWSAVVEAARHLPVPQIELPLRAAAQARPVRTPVA